MDTRPNPAAVTAAVKVPTDQASPLQRLAAMPNRNKIGLALGVMLLTALLAWGLSAGRQTDYRVLYASLSDKDGGSVIAALQQMNVAYKYAEGGGAILVPADKVHDARLKLASQGLPRGGAVGFELMENQKFGTTQFQERLNFQRGLEGELARSIMSLQAVNQARVHLALPQQTAFLREQQKPSASVLLTLHGGRTLDRGQVAGIVHLVASSVPDMQPRAVSVVDQNGTLLSQASEGPGAGLDAPQLQYVRQAEQSLQQRILTILEPIVGAGNVRAQVTAEIDFTQSESTAETYAPNQGSSPQAVRSQHLSEAPGAGGAGAGGVPGALSNQPAATPASQVNGAPGAIQPPGASSGAAAGVKRDAVTNYEVDKTIKVTRNATGNIRRLSAAVVVNHMSLVGADGKAAAPAALPAAQMEQVNALVREAIGFSKERGDTVQVVNAPFTSVAPPPAVELPLWRQPEMQDLARSLAPWLGLPLAALVVILGFIRPALKTARAPAAPRLSATVRDAIELAPADGGASGVTKVSVEPDADAPALLPTAEASRQQARTTQLDHIRQLAKADPATVANVVRNWASQPA
ncbi:flagellar basal-body MS-ring/collar protein FliF [Ramlibacter humi]|uniref:Flagellar M-ring protein n=1 Tax=Ramlibacter humi TaxID=2530451 RepID=A0A4Z0C9K2_9BURK|nr:flagellar basal-body MS-ring/collar protein FliF [Ramlibacter humi]TFZ08346.1 flagellar basal body M-ring protein FliF [Ramlibacter humi]